MGDSVKLTEAPPWPTPQQIEQERERLTGLLVAARSPTFCARDLGFPGHTLIHEAACAIIAKYAAEQVVMHMLSNDAGRAALNKDRPNAS